MPNNDRPIVPINRSSFDSAYGIRSKAAVGSSPKFSIDREALEHFLDDEPAIVQPAQVSFASLQKEAQRLYVEVDIKCEQFGAILKQLKLRSAEGGYESWRACVKSTFPTRSLQWADKILREYDDATLFRSTGEERTNESDKKDKPALNTTSQSQSEPKGDGGSAGQSRHTPVGQPAANGATPKPRTENGKPVSEMAVFHKLYEHLGKTLPIIADANRAVRNPARMDRFMAHIKGLMNEVELWRLNK